MIFVILGHVTISSVLSALLTNSFVLICKWAVSSNVQPIVQYRNSLLKSKKRSAASKQGNVSASVRIAEFGKATFYADNGKLFCRPCNVVVDHVRKNRYVRSC